MILEKRTLTLSCLVDYNSFYTLLQYIIGDEKCLVSHISLFVRESAVGESWYKDNGEFQLGAFFYCVSERKETVISVINLSGKSQ